MTVFPKQRLKHIADVRFSNVDKLSEPDEVPVRLCNYTDVYKNEQITNEMPFMEATATAGEIRRFGLQVGDVILTKDSETPTDIAVPAVVASSAPDLVCGYHLAVARPISTLLNGRFLLRTLQASGIREQFYVRANGVTRFGLSQDAIGDALIPVPPLNEQSRIADFLDHKTTTIDTLIAKKEQFLALLAEKRQGLITQAVTKGLDPSAPMRNSGVEWAGPLPAHWKALQIKRFARPGLRTFTDGDWIEAPYVTDHGVRLLQTGNVGTGFFKEQGGRFVSDATFDELRCTLLEPGDVMICRLDGPVGRACIAPELGVRMITSVDNAILKVGSGHDSRYIVYALSCPRYLEWVQALCRVGGGFRFRISRSMLGGFALPAPPCEEQRQIADYLDRAIAASRAAEERIEAYIDKLREYRQALITAAVTGQLDLASGTQTAHTANQSAEAEVA